MCGGGSQGADYAKPSLEALVERAPRQSCGASRDRDKAPIAEAVIRCAKALTHSLTLISGGSRPAMPVNGLIHSAGVNAPKNVQIN